VDCKQTEGEADELEVFLRPEDGKDINGILLRKGDLAEVFQAAIQQLMDSGDFETIWTKWGLQNVILKTATINGGTVDK
jgi:ABC-type amino acid transport substrate-binding protein